MQRSDAPRKQGSGPQQSPSFDHVRATSKSPSDASASTGRVRIDDHARVRNIRLDQRGPATTTPADTSGPGQIMRYTDHPYDGKLRLRRPLPPTPAEVQARASSASSTQERLTRSMVDALQIGQEGKAGRNPQSDAAPQSLQRDGARDTTTPTTGDRTRQASDRYLALLPQRLQNRIARRAADVFVRRCERVERVNTALRIVHEVGREYNRQAPHGLHQAHLQVWEHRLNQAEQTLQRIQQKGLKSSEQFITYSNTRINRSLGLMSRYGQLSDAEQQRLTDHKETMLNTTRQYPPTEIASALRNIHNAKEVLSTVRRDFCKESIRAALTDEKIHQAHQRLGLPATHYRDIINSGRYLPYDRVSPHAYQFAWKSPDGGTVVRRFLGRGFANTPDTYRRGQLQDDNILMRCNATHKVVQLRSSDMQYQCHGLTFSAGDASISYRDVTDILHTRFHQLPRMQDAKVGDIVVYTHNVDNAQKRITHTGIVVSNNNGDVICVSKFNLEGGLYMHRPGDVQAAFGTPAIHSTDHPSGRFLMPDNTVDLEQFIRAGYV